MELELDSIKDEEDCLLDDKMFSDFDHIQDDQTTNNSDIGDSNVSGISKKERRNAREQQRALKISKHITQLKIFLQAAGIQVHH